MTEQRYGIVRAALEAENLDAIMIFGRPNMHYLCGFTGTDGVLFLNAETTVFLTDSRYHSQAQHQVTASRILCYKNKLKAVGDLCGELNAVRVGFDADIVSVALLHDLMESSPLVEWVPLKDHLKSLRAVKSEKEVLALKKAANLNHQAFDNILSMIQPGVCERDIALELEFALKRLGGEANAFDFIVASGVRGAMPHGVASAKKIHQGELLTIDFGTCVEGYYSDETVTLAIGEVDRKLRQIFDIVLEAHDLALKAVCPGMALSALDAIARDFIELKGYGAYFGHGLGHGVGLEIHEYPGVSPNAEDTLAEGMVITVEPGIYLPDIGGVRIEDTIVVTAEGCEILTSIPKYFRQI